ncbi:MAG TPA: DUF1214 domain-containing protein [Mycobacterium sp.]|nr:DUF1214 domain-containing protein [Mycobacterium sp.]
MTDDADRNVVKTAAWLPHSIFEAGFDEAAPADLLSSWKHLLDRLNSASQVVLDDAVSRTPRDAAAGIRHLLVLLAAGADEVLGFDPQPAPVLRPAAMDDKLSWGMECPDCLYHRAALQPGASYRLFGNRGTARYVGLQTMDGIASTANALVDELDVDADGNFEVILSADRQPGNWLQLAGAHPVLTIRHFFYDWDTEVPSSLALEQISEVPGRQPVSPPLESALPGQLSAVGDFVLDNLTFFLQFGGAPPANGFLPPADFSAQGAAAENRPVIGRWELQPDEALVLEIEPPNGVYWSFSLGNPWWETIHYGRHQSSLNGHQAAVDPDGRVRVVVSAEDPGIANWLDTAGFSNGALILRCVRTDTAPVPAVTRAKFSELEAILPKGVSRVSPDERAAQLAARRRAVSERFA